MSVCENNILWVGFYGKGICGYKNCNLDGVPDYHFLPDNSVSSVVCDKEGAYWFSTLDDGVYYLPSLNFNYFTQIDGLKEENVTCLTSSSQGNLILGYTSMFISEKTEDGFIHHQIDDLTDNCIYDIALNPTSSELLIGTLGRIYYFDNGKIRRQVHNHVNASKTIKGGARIGATELQIDSLNNIWGASFKGFFRIVDNKVVFDSFLDEDFGKRIYSIQLVEDKCMILGGAKGLWKYAFGEMGEKGEYYFYGDKYQKLNTRVNVVRNGVEKDCYWIGTKSEGLLYLTKDTLFEINTSNGLAGNDVCAVFQKDNIVWVCSNGGLSKITVRNFDKMDIQVVNISDGNGLLSNDVNDIYFIDPFLYVATRKGVTYFDIHCELTNTIPPPVYITNINISNRDTVLSDFYELDYYKNFVKIDFIGLAYKAAGNVEYKYMMIGIDEDWVNTKNTQINYTTLPSGNYEFRVAAKNENGVWSKEYANVVFAIGKPWWKTWWAYVIFIMGIVLFVAAIFSLIQFFRIKEIKKRHEIQRQELEMRNRLKQELNKYMQQALGKQMNPHFIFNSLNSIQHYILQNDKRASNKYLSMFSKLMRSTLNNSWEETIPIETELETLKLYMELEALRFKDKMEYSIVVDEELDVEKFRIPTLLIQPYVENAIWHGIMHKEANGKVKVELIAKDDNILCIIEDNGIGRDAAMKIKEAKPQKHESLGTDITRNRLELINSLFGSNMTLLYIDLKDPNGICTGTRVELSLPYIE